MITIDPERLDRSSASSAYRRRRCAGSVNLVDALREADSLPQPEPDEAAQSGILVHRAWCDTAEVHNYSALSPMQKDTLASLLRMEKLVVTDWAGNDEYTLLTREERLWLHEGLEPIHSGQPDVIYGTIYTRRMLIIDGKTMFGEVTPAEQNDQLRELVALARFNYPGCEHFTVVILQPWISARPSIAYYDATEAELALRLLRLTIAENADPDAPRTPGPWCRYCPALAKCEEARAHVGMTYNLVKRIESGQFAIPIGTDGARILDSVETAEIALKAIKASYKALIAHEPDAVPGWYLKAGNQVREISDLGSACEIAEEFAHLTPVEFMDCCKLVVGSLESKVGEELKLNGKALTDRFNDLFSEVITFKQNAPTLTRESATRGRHKEINHETGTH